jgi:uncharacterized damage-inducible protein DinB
MDYLEHVRLMAAYNRWFNERIYDAAATLPADQRFADRHAFFSSIGGTLNHLVAGDSIWLRRFAASPCATAVREADAWLPRPNALNQILYPDWDELRSIRARIDGVIDQWVAGIEPADLECALAYKNSRGEAHRRQLGPLLSHFFNHQTHHRGQATALLFQAGVDPGITDLLTLIPQAR